MHRVVLFYTLDATVEVEDGGGGSGFADAAVEGIVMVGGGGAVVHAYQEVAVVVLICVATIAEHIAIAVILHGFVANGGVGIHVIVIVCGCNTVGIYHGTIPESIHIILLLF